MSTVSFDIILVGTALSKRGDVMDNILIDMSPEEICSELSYELDGTDEFTISEEELNDFASAFEQSKAKAILHNKYGSGSVELPHKNEKGEYLVKGEDGSEVAVPVDFSPFVEYSFNCWGFAAKAHTASWFQTLGEYIIGMFRWILGIKKSLNEQLKQILINANDHYQSYRDTIGEMLAEYDDEVFNFLLAIPDMFVYACRLISDSEIPKKIKVGLAMALIYLVSPVDFIPEALIWHPVAYLDDLAVMVFIVRLIISNDILKLEKLEEHWPGNISIIKCIDEIYSAILELIDEQIIKKIIAILSKMKKGAK
jgi:uncharacterized membrane protein YkvA (DUF1232 family)